MFTVQEINSLIDTFISGPLQEAEEARKKLYKAFKAGNKKIPAYYRKTFEQVTKFLAVPVSRDENARDRTVQDFLETMTAPIIGGWLPFEKLAAEKLRTLRTRVARRIRLKVMHFQCGCGKVHNNYLVPADGSSGSSWSATEIMEALGLRVGDVIEIRRVEKC